MSDGLVDDIVTEVRKGFNHERFDYLLDNPPKFLYNYNNKKFEVNPKVFRKMCMYVYDMVFKVKDCMAMFGGEEGTGKSVYATQVGQMAWHIMYECNILREDLGTYYDYTYENCMGQDLEEFNELCDKYYDVPFRIFICDEAGDLKGEDRFQQENKDFRGNMRKDRKCLRFRILCYPQPFELVNDFLLARVNFFMINKERPDPKGRGSIPDTADMIIIPRSEFQFSYHTKEIYSKEEIKKELKEMKKERYTKEINKRFIHTTFQKDDVFCFNAKTYIKKAKEYSRITKADKNVYLTPNVTKLLAQNLTAGKIGLSTTRWKNPELSKEEKKEAEREKRDALQISKLVNNCRKWVENNPNAVAKEEN